MAVYDGHGGTGVANYLKDHLHEFILAQPEYRWVMQWSTMDLSLAFLPPVIREQLWYVWLLIAWLYYFRINSELLSKVVRFVWFRPTGSVFDSTTSEFHLYASKWMFDIFGFQHILEMMQILWNDFWQRRQSNSFSTSLSKWFVQAIKTEKVYFL